MSTRTASDKIRLQDWLAGKVRQQMMLSLLGTIALLAAGAAVTFVTFWMVYGVIWIGFVRWFDLSHNGVLLASAVIIVLLFIGNATTDRDYLDRFEIDLGPHRGIQVAVARAAGHGWMTAFAGPKTARATIKMATTLLYTGPRLISDAQQLLRRALRLRALPLEACSRVLRMALKAGKRVPFTEIAERYPRLDFETVFTALPSIDGVVYLPSDPPGIVLAPQLVEEIAEWRENQIRP